MTAIEPTSRVMPEPESGRGASLTPDSLRRRAAAIGSVLSPANTGAAQHTAANRIVDRLNCISSLSSRVTERPGFGLSGPEPNAEAGRAPTVLREGTRSL